MEFVPDFLLIPYQLIRDKRIEPNDRLVYAVVYWFEHLKDGRCIASNMTIASLLGITTRGVQNSLTSLEQNGYIERTYKDEAHRNRASIITKISFKAVRSDGDRQKTSEPLVTVERTPGDRASELVVTRTRIGNKNRNKKETSVAPGAGAEINKLIDLFKPVNPSFERLFRIPPQRAALERMVEKWGVEKIRNAITASAQVFGKPYAPTITTPLQLESKMGQLASFLRKEGGVKKQGLVKI